MRFPPLRVGSLKEDHEDSAADVGFQASSSPCVWMEECFEVK
ncbi:hypothetical protein A2U01_0100669 [Trifolium medium]|uniref:Uncharacterized protein n=1 Tax=Trifolium medium TaxID=97028 RepID=A0A392UTP1_9FABA|nr:hypothetical protein [Trifolium medium]